jgi:lysophospholipase L1-like esterase
VALQNPRNDARHAGFVEIAKAGNIDLLFVGDSITDLWDDRAKGIWDSTWGPLKPANFGISGDTTQGVLWRMQNGELEGFKAKLIVLMLGTNNTARNSVDEIVDDDRLIVEEFKKRQPQSKVLILDAKDSFKAQDLFEDAWARHYPGMIEWLPAQFTGGVKAVDLNTRSVITEGMEFKAAVANVIPAQSAGPGRASPRPR